MELTNLDTPLFDGAGATKRDLIDYLEAVADRIIPELADRPLSVIRVHRGQEAFMQKNLPSYTPAWVQRVTMWAESSKREVTLRALQRPADAAVVREPARCRVSPVADPSRQPRAHDSPGARHRSAARRCVCRRRARRTCCAAGPRRRGPGCRHQDKRRERPAHLRSHRHAACPSTQPLPPPARSPRVQSERIPPRSPPPSSRTTAAARCSSIRRASAGPRWRCVQPASASRRPRVVSRWTGTTWTAFRLPTSPCSPPCGTSAMGTDGQCRCRSRSGSPPN